MKYSALALSILACSVGQAYALEALDDTELSQSTGQSLLNMSVVDPGGTNPNPDVGFYKLALQADVELNANIRKMQLGCGGVNGPNACDIDIDYTRLVGFGTLDANGRPINDAGPKSDFLLRNPYLELAIKNPDSLTDRQVVGFRVGAAQAQGIMSVGTRPVDASGNPVGTSYDVDYGDVTNKAFVPDEHTGVNRLSAVIDRLEVVNGSIPIAIGLGIGNPIAGTGRINPGNPCNNDAGKCKQYMIPQYYDYTDGQYKKTAGSNIFQNVTVARAKDLRIAPLTIVVESTSGLANGKVSVADMISDNRFIHNIQVGTETTPANDYYFSFSTLGDNKVRITNAGDYGISRSAGGDYTTVVNAPEETSVGNWIKWQNTSGTWVPLMRGFALHLPEVKIANFTSPPVNANGWSAIFNASKANITDQLDIQQVPVDNCYGGLNFC